MYNKIIQNIKPLEFMWPVMNPYVFCVHHLDDYPSGNEEMGPQASLAGRYLGQDFTLKDGWRMYHGERVPGFPAHPHRGFETVTVVLDGFVDHSDSHGAAGRYGMGDVQWMTSGKGLQHCEMFPLRHQDKGNRLELFQIWLNLPKKDKFAPPHFKMLWAEQIPEVKSKDKNGKETKVNVYAGSYDGHKAPAPAPDSWAANPENGVNIWTVKIEKGGFWTLPGDDPEMKRMLYFYKGGVLKAAGVEVSSGYALELLPDQDIIIQAVDDDAYLLFLQGLPIDEPVVQHGPFVMNTAEEIHQAIADYRQTQFGGWPWQRYDHVHPRDQGRFAKYASGKTETP
ncbi:MAG: pirin family protein [Bacteroidales bacterium]|nr:pirin family protein [Bacteroidales bacterium]